MGQIETAAPTKVRGAVRLRVARHIRRDSHPVTWCGGDDLGAGERGPVRVDNRCLDGRDGDPFRQAFMQQELLVGPAVAVAFGDFPRLGLALLGAAFPTR